MCKKSMISNQKGLTLIELLISMALLFVVIGIIFSMHIFGIRSLSRGIAKRDLQADMRLAMDAISKEVRYSEEISLTSGDATYDHIYVSANKVMVKPADASERSLTDAIISNPASDLKFSIENNGENYLLHIEMSGTYKGNTSYLETDLFLPNISEASISSNTKNIYYKKLAVEAESGGGPGPSEILAFGTASTLPDAIRNESYSTTITASGGSGSYNFSSSDMPGWLTLNASSGVLSGAAPNSESSYSFSITVQDGEGKTVTSTFDLAVVSSPLEFETASTLPDAKKKKSYSKTISATGGSGGYQYTATGLPSWLTLNKTSGVLSGTAPNTTGSNAFTITVSDSVSNSSSSVFTLYVGN